MIVDVELGGAGRFAVLAGPLANELHPEGAVTGFEFLRDEGLLGLDTQEVVDVVQLVILDEQRVPTEPGAVGENHPFGLRRHLHVGENLVGAPTDIDRRALRHRRGVGVVDIARPRRLGLRAGVAQLFDGGPIIQGQNEIRFRLGEPDVDEFLEFFGVFGGEVARLRAILIDVEELPWVLVKVALTADRGVQGRGLPAVLPQAAGAQHRVVLPLLLGRRIGLVEAVAHRHSVERVLLNAAIDLRHLQTGDVQDGRDDVGGVMVLVAHLALGLDALGPVDHQRIAGAAGVLGVALEHRERCGERRRPAGRVVVVGLRAAKGVEVLHVLAQLVGVAVEELVLVD